MDRRTITCQTPYASGLPFRCSRPAGHDGRHEDRTSDAPSIIAWPGPATYTAQHDRAASYAERIAYRIPASCDADDTGRCVAPHAVLLHPGVPTLVGLTSEGRAVCRTAEVTRRCPLGHPWPLDPAVQEHRPVITGDPTEHVLVAAVAVYTADER